ncbi:hypothetical protein OEZ85_000262 [Tetradesmus obliquus]|uniref:DUF4200 domain-containing protein n=1 Tax=Tetradesmus obliquus TaxID=3088 RepID=A0ABY8UT61_TETOB|nr:hypothetical protein OEZ85_000262 [Tetradesmus obliquus]
MAAGGLNEALGGRMSQPTSKIGFASSTGAALLAEPSTGRNSVAPSRREAASMSGAAANNPFTIPADEDIFRLQDEQRAERRAAKNASAALSVVDKSTFASRQQALFTDTIKAGFREVMRADAQAVGVGDGSLASVACAGVPHRVERENIKDFLAKKRETFLVQMSLDTKRAETRKLEERARQREEALKKSEAMLEEDGLRFDAFLKENDEKVQEAIKRADTEAKAKQDKLHGDAEAKAKQDSVGLIVWGGEWILVVDSDVQEAFERADTEAKAKQDKALEIKRLNAAIAGLRSELNKQEEALEDCRRYKEFLDSVTPKEWFVAQAARQEQRRQEQLAAWRAECDALRAQREAAAAARSKAEADFSNAHTQQEAEQAERAIKEATAALKEANKAKEPPPPVFDDASSAAAGVAGPAASAAGSSACSSLESMYFTAPQQLLQVYADLEESNLFLIQVCQESEEQLEEIRGHYRATQEKLNAEVTGLQSQISALEGAIAAASARAALLKARAAEGEVAQSRLCLGGGSSSSANASRGAGTNSSQEDGNAAAAAGDGGEVVSLEELSSKVAQVYQRCGFDADASLATLSMHLLECGFDADASLATLSMLTSIEVRLEEALAAVAGLPQEQVSEAEKGRERERRQVAREDKLAAARAEHETRVARALERAAAPVFKKTGKPVMYRSRPPQRKVVVESTKEDAEEAELVAFLARDLL